MRRLLKRLAIAAVAILALMQLYRPARTNPTVEAGSSIESRLRVNPEALSVLRQACFDCHSNETDWPWYSNVAPVSWFVIGHVDEARGHMNFSEWSRFDPRHAEHQLEEICEEVEEDRMPLPSYRLVHPEGRPTGGQVEALCRWTTEARKGLMGEEAGAP